MNATILALAAIQAALLLSASVYLSNIFILPDKSAQIGRGVAALALALAIAWFAPQIDLHRVLCSLGDCLVLVSIVGTVRFWAVTKEEEQFAFDRQLELQLAAEIAQARDVERIKTAALDLEKRTAEQIRKETAAAQPQRRATSSLLGRSAPSPQSPTLPPS